MPSTNPGQGRVALRARKTPAKRSWVGCISAANWAFAARLAAFRSSPGPVGTGPKKVVSSLASASGVAVTATHRRGRRPGAPSAAGNAPSHKVLQIRY
jgi:hypothetical protein